MTLKTYYSFENYAIWIIAWKYFTNIIKWTQLFWKELLWRKNKTDKSTSNVLSRCCSYHQNSDFFSIKSTHTHVRQAQSNKHCYTKYLAVEGHIFWAMCLNYSQKFYIKVYVYIYCIYNWEWHKFFHVNGYINEIFKKCNNKQCMIRLKHKKISIQGWRCWFTRNKKPALFRDLLNIQHYTRHELTLCRYLCVYMYIINI